MKFFNLINQPEPDEPEPPVVYRKDYKMFKTPTTLWTEHVKMEGNRNDKYRPYDSRLVVFITKDRRIVLSEKTYNSLNAPEYITFNTDGNGRIALRPVPNTNVNSYKVCKWHSAKVTSKHHHITAASFLKGINTIPSADKPIVYDVVIENGMAIIDTNQKPSILV